MVKANIFSVGGTVQASKGIYLIRQADKKLLELCQQGEFTYILTSRQIGKSSLMISTASELKKAGVKSVIIDLTKIGIQVSVEQWYLGLLLEIEEQLMLDTDVEEWWEDNENVGVTQRLSKFFQDVLLEEVTSPVVVFVDEIDTTLSLDFTDDFFAAIRYFYLARAQDAKLQRLSFVLIGVATPGDLIRDLKRTPFNIGQRLDLTDFTFEEAMPLAEGLGLAREPAQQLLRWVLEWTGGHPYLTQRLCSVINQENKDSWSSAAVKQVVSSTFFGAMSKQDNNLQFVRDMLTKRAPNQDEVLSIYRQIRLGRGSVVDEEQSIIKSHLKLSGVVRRENNVLRLRNRIYGQVFDRKWINENLPFSLRDRWEQLKPAIPYIGLLLLISLATTAVLIAVSVDKRRQIIRKAYKQTEKQRVELAAALQKRKVAQQAEAKQRQIAEEQTKEAKKQKRIAEKQRIRAEKGEKQAKSAQKIAEQRGVELAAALQKAKVAQQAEARQRKVAEEQRNIAQQQEQEARTAQADAEKQKANAEILAETLNAKNLLESNLEIKALVAGLKAGKKVKQLNKDVEPDNRVRAIIALQQVLYVRERNSLSGGHIGLVYSVAFSSDGSTIATASDDGTVKLWNSQGVEQKTLKGHSGSVYSVAFSGDDKTIASASYDGTVKLWNSQGVEQKTLKGHGGTVNSVAFSSDGKTIASASSDRTVKLWNSQGVELQTLKGHSGNVNSVAFSSDGKTIASASDDGTVKLWNSQGVELQTLKGHGGSVYSVAFSGDGKTIASASDDKTVKLWNSQGVELQTLKGHSGEVNSIVFNGDGKTIASASDDGTVKLWNTQRLQTLKGHSGNVNSVAFSGDGKTIASASYDKTVKLWNSQGKEIKTLSHSHWVRSVAFSSDSKTIASASDDKTVKLWNSQGVKIKTLKGHSDFINSVAFSPNGNTIATASDDDTVKLWNSQGVELQTLKWHRGNVNNVAFSPNGNTIATASDDRTVKLWNSQGVELQTLKDHSGSVYSVAFSPDGKTMISTSSDQIVKLWNFDLDDLLAQACAWIGDYLKNNRYVSKEDRRLCDGITVKK